MRRMNLCDLSSVDSARWKHGRSTSYRRSTWGSWTRSSHHDTSATTFSFFSMAGSCCHEEAMSIFKEIE
jgi:hypothetical protein